MQINFKWITTKDEQFKDAVALRTKVFVEEQGYTPEMEFDEKDETARHVVGYDGDKAVCTARVFYEKSQVLYLGRICVLPQYRGKNIGAELVCEMQNLAKNENATQIVLGAQVPKRGFYEKQGLVAYGDEYDDGGIMHIMMKKSL
ncbi:MAG: GNAT family N-acetyltransferase [Oscillospiraceae bacterium]